MSYRPDYERALNKAVQTVIPKTPEDWGLIALSILGILVVILVLEAMRNSFTRP